MLLVPLPDAAGNETMSPQQIVSFLNSSGFEVFADHWNEQDLYFGKHHTQVMDIDRLFGSDKFKLATDEAALHAAAALILRAPLDVAGFNHKQFLKGATDVIAIERGLADRMKRKWLSAPAAPAA